MKHDLEFDAFRETVKRYFHCDASVDHYEKAFVFFTAAKSKGIPITDEDLQWAKSKYKDK